VAVQVGGVRVGAAARFWFTMAVLPLGLALAVYSVVSSLLDGPLALRLLVTAASTAAVALLWTRFVRSASWWLVKVWLGIR
jgi:membrane protein implicated in regulation of membrane protease activity